MKKTEGFESQAGFSMVELLIAMVVTLIISSAIYGLMASGQTAFKRDPEITDRQQNIRVAMDLIENDVVAAGANLGANFQVFTDGQDGLGPNVGQGPTDYLEIYTKNAECPDLVITDTQGANFTFPATAPSCYTSRSLVVVMYNGTPTGLDCSKWELCQQLRTAPNAKCNFPGGLQPPGGPGNATEMKDCPTGSGSNPYKVGLLNIVRYEIANEADGVPGLWRSTTGGMDIANGVTFYPAPNPLGNWQLVARGIEDLQVQYLNGGGVWADNPGVVVAGVNATIVQQVRTTLGARTINLATTNVQQQNIHGQLTSVGVPRAALQYLGLL